MFCILNQITELVKARIRGESPAYLQVKYSQMQASLKVGSNLGAHFHSLKYRMSTPCLSRVAGGPVHS